MRHLEIKLTISERVVDGKNRCSVGWVCTQRSKILNMSLYLLSDGHTDSDILMKWRNPKIEIGNKEMAQFSVGEAVLTTEVNMYSTGKISRLLFAKAIAATPNSKSKTFFLYF